MQCKARMPFVERMFSSGCRDAFERQLEGYLHWCVLCVFVCVRARALVFEWERLSVCPSVCLSVYWHYYLLLIDAVDHEHIAVLRQGVGLEPLEHHLGRR